MISFQEHIIHIKDFYTDDITSVTVQNCKHLKVVVDCPILQRTSRLQRFAIKNCQKLEFVTLSSSSLVQTPPEVIIDNVGQIVAFPQGLFKSPSNTSERKCMGAPHLKQVLVRNAKISVVNTGAIYNVTGARLIDFTNVTIDEVQSQAIEAILGEGIYRFTMNNCRIVKLMSNSITVDAKLVTISANRFGDLKTNAINITSDFLHITENVFGDIESNGLLIKSANSDITNNYIRTLKSNAFSNVKCGFNKASRRHFNFMRNTIENVEPNSLIFDFASCKTARTVILFRENRIDCRCTNIAFLNSGESPSELTSLIMNLQSNNTCLHAPCLLPVEVVKILKESAMCQLNLDPQVMCLLYYDKNGTTNKETSTSEDVTEATATFYLIKQANSPRDAPSAAMTAVDKDRLLKDSHASISNRTTVRIIFDSSKDFEETLRSTNSKKPCQKTPEKGDTPKDRCVGGQCRNSVAYDKQKALDFYKYVYAQLRPPKTESPLKT